MQLLLLDYLLFIKYQFRISHHIISDHNTAFVITSQLLWSIRTHKLNHPRNNWIKHNRVWDQHKWILCFCLQIQSYWYYQIQLTSIWVNLKSATTRFQTHHNTIPSWIICTIHLLSLLQLQINNVSIIQLIIQVVITNQSQIHPITITNCWIYKFNPPSTFEPLLYSIQSLLCTGYIYIKALFIWSLTSLTVIYINILFTKQQWAMTYHIIFVTK